MLQIELNSSGCLPKRSTSLQNLLGSEILTRTSLEFLERSKTSRINDHLLHIRYYNSYFAQSINRFRFPLCCEIHFVFFSCTHARYVVSLISHPFWAFSHSQGLSFKRNLTISPLCLFDSKCVMKTLHRSKYDKTANMNGNILKAFCLIITANSCCKPTIPDHSMFFSDNRYNFGDKVYTKCDTGYVTGGTALRTCQNNGQYTGAPTTCTSECNEIFVT